MCFPIKDRIWNKGLNKWKYYTGVNFSSVGSEKYSWNLSRNKRACFLHRYVRLINTSQAALLLLPLAAVDLSAKLIRGTSSS